jgi:hypothetical protein
MTDPETSPAVKALAARENAAERQRRSRSSRDMARAEAAMAANPGNFVVPKMPRNIRGLRIWMAEAHDEYSGNVTGQRRVSPIELMEMRRSMTAVLETYKISALVRQARAAMRQAEATERLADALSSMEHGGAAVALLARLREMPGETRPLPFRRLTPMPKSTGEGA